RGDPTWPRPAFARTRAGAASPSARVRQRSPAHPTTRRGAREAWGPAPAAGASRARDYRRSAGAARLRTPGAKVCEGPDASGVPLPRKMQRRGIWQAVILCTALAGAVLAGCGEKDEPEPATV